MPFSVYLGNTRPEVAAEIVASMIKPETARGMLWATERLIDKLYEEAMTDAIGAAVYDGQLSYEKRHHAGFVQEEALWLKRFCDQLRLLLKKNGHIQ